MDRLYRLCTFLQHGTLKLFADLKVEGVENVPPMGPLIIVANHQGNFDPPLLAATLPRRVRFLAKDGLFRHPVANWFMSTYGAFPLRREGRDPRAFRWALDHLAQDGVLAFFPEGTRSRGAMSKANIGIARLALKSQAPLLPVAITGTERLGHWLRVVNPTGRFTVTFGTVFSLPSLEGRLSGEVLESLTDSIMHRVAALLPASYRGVYGARPADLPPRAANDVGSQPEGERVAGTPLPRVE